MSKLGKKACCALVLGLASILLFSMAGWTSYFYAASQPQVQSESARLEHIRTETIRRVEKTELLVRDLMDGCSTLGETSQEFLKIHEGTPAFQSQHPLLHNSGSLLESAARDLATRAFNREINEEKRHELAIRLEAEFRTLVPDAQPLHLVYVPVSQGHQSPSEPGAIQQHTAPGKILKRSE